MLFRELNRGKCKTYLIACERTRCAALIDPVKGHVDRYLSLLAYEGLKLHAVIDTHTHADHPTGAFLLRDLTGARLVMHRRAPVPVATDHVVDGDVIRIGDLEVKVLYTPGHTPDGISLYVDGRVFTGDTLLIGGTGRADFAGGDAGAEYDSIAGKLFQLPDDTVVYPAHDYRGNTSSTIGQEKRANPRVAGRSRDEYVALMASLNFPLPEKIQEVLQPNQSAIEDDKTKFPDLVQLNSVRQLNAQEVAMRMGSGEPPFVVDVREPQEYTGELGHIAGSTLIPLRDLADRAGELIAHKARPIVVVCRSGVRSTTGAAILSGLGFDKVYNLQGGMIDWNDNGLPTER
ncbi:MAG TPA: MBL fold metallo-hydrolase [Burkholderiales bacterium]|nr:MBL fold metallo-hydrolase [Burkholderiales bacterium]